MKAYDTSDDEDVNYVNIDDGEVSDVYNELELEEELSEHEDIDEAGCDEFVEQETYVSIPVSACALITRQKNIIPSVKLAICSGKKTRLLPKHGIGTVSPAAAPDQ